MLKKPEQERKIKILNPLTFTPSEVQGSKKYVSNNNLQVSKSYYKLSMNIINYVPSSLLQKITTKKKKQEKTLSSQVSFSVYFVFKIDNLVSEDEQEGLKEMKEIKLKKYNIAKAKSISFYFNIAQLSLVIQ